MAVGDSDDCDPAPDLRLPVLLRDCRQGSDCRQAGDDFIDFTVAQNVRGHRLCRWRPDVSGKELAAKSRLYCGAPDRRLCPELFTLITRCSDIIDDSEH